MESSCLLVFVLSAWLCWFCLFVLVVSSYLVVLVMSSCFGAMFIKLFACFGFVCFGGIISACFGGVLMSTGLGSIFISACFC